MSRGLGVTGSAHPTTEIFDTLTRIGLVALLAVGFSACGSKGGVPANSNQSPSNPQTGAVNSSAPTAPDVVPGSAPARTEFKTGEAVPAGYFGYKVFGSWFSGHLPADAKTVSAENYLYVDLAVVNTDKKERAVPTLKLVDEAGKEYALSQKSDNAGRSVGDLEKIAPNVSKRVLAIFAVPKGPQYKLKIEGFSASEAVTITLSPAAAAPKP